MRVSRALSPVILTALATLFLSGLAAPAAEAEICEFRVQNHTRNLQQVDYTGHQTGKHRSKAVPKFKCVCQNDCRSTCQPYWKSKTCEDTGILQGFKIHRPRVAMRLRTGERTNALSVGADCGAGYGCFIQECRPGQCVSYPIAVSVKPVGVGISITFTPDRAELADLQLDFPFQCDECMTKDEVAEELGGNTPEQEYDDPGPGGGGSWSWTTCGFRCRIISFDGSTYTEECELLSCS